MQTFYFKGKTDFLKREQLDERPINKTCNMIILSYRPNNHILDNFYFYKACIYEKVTRKTVSYFISWILVVYGFNKFFSPKVKEMALKEQILSWAGFEGSI